MTTIQLFGGIGPGSAAAVRSQLAQVREGSPITVEINSDGGSVSEAAAIYALLSAWRGVVTTSIVGWALSAATMVAMAGSRRLAQPTSLLMVHAPHMSTGGNAQSLRQDADALDQVAQSMRAAYRRTGQKDAVISTWLDSGEDHWFTSDQALAAGLITEIASEPESAVARHAFAQCRHPIPHHILERVQAMTTTTTAAAPAPAPDTAAIQAAARTAEFERQRDIRANFAPFAKHEGMADIEAACLNDPNCTAAAAGQKILAKMAAGVTSAAGRYVPDVGKDRMGDFQAAAVDALCMRAGVPVAKPHPAARDLMRTSIVTIAESIISMRGGSTQGLGPAGVIRAALSTSDFPLLLSNSANKSLLRGYEGAPQTHAIWTSDREARDFKTNTLLALGEAPSLQLVPELAEYTYGSMAEAAETFALGKYGKIIRLSREALINDDLSAFTAVPASMGAASRRLEADLVYGRLTANPTMSDGIALFHASHGNLAASGAAPSITSLGAARAAMRKQKGVGGIDYIDPTPRFMVVPVALETLCEQLLASLVDPAMSNATPNVEWIRRLTLVADPRLDDDSATAWYLAADPGQIEGIARVYLAGEPRPAIEDDAGFTVDAMSWKVRLEFAASVVGWRALYKNPGA